MAEANVHFPSVIDVDIRTQDDRKRKIPKLILRRTFPLILGRLVQRILHLFFLSLSLTCYCADLSPLEDVDRVFHASNIFQVPTQANFPGRHINFLQNWRNTIFLPLSLYLYNTC